MDQLFLSLTLVLGLATLFAMLTRLLRLPIIVAYILAGITLAFAGPHLVRGGSIFTFLPEVGIAFLLFLIGMELDFREMLHVGKSVVISATAQMLISGMSGFFLARLFGLAPLEAAYAGIALAFSSTITVIKLLTERNDETSLHGRLSIGILLIEDLVAILILMILSISPLAFSFGLPGVLEITALGIRIVLFFVVTVYLSRYILPTLFGFFAHSLEFLLLSAVAFCFLWITISQSLGFSLEIGAFLAGLALASSPYRLQIAGRIKPLRDFFIALFFVNLGAQAHLGDILATPAPFAVFTIYAILAKPVIFIVVLSLLGYRKHPTFLTSINLTQISEFSLIVLIAGLHTNAVSSATLSTFALVAAVSIIASSILITNGKWLYKLVFPVISLFERHQRRATVKHAKTNTLSHHFIVVGCHRSGRQIVEYLAGKRPDKLVAIDFNPEIVKDLARQKIPVIFGDVADPDILTEANVGEAKMIISTIRDFEDTRVLLGEAKKTNPHIFLIVSAQTDLEVAKLKKHGADKVVIPEALEGQHIVNFLSREYFG